MKKIISRSCITLLLAFTLQAGVSQVSDIDGKKYKTTIASSQVWTAENLNVSHFRNGDSIPEIRSAEAWANAGIKGEPGWCYYDNDPANGIKYGKLYNWYAVHDTRGLAPEGWRVPVESDWAKLVAAMGGSGLAGPKLKSISGWGNKEIDHKETGFAGIPGGYRNDFGSCAFENKGSFASLWSGEKYDSSDAWMHQLVFSRINLTSGSESQGAGMSVRCVKK